MLMEILKKCILLEDEGLDWIPIWTLAPSLNEKGKRAIKKNLVFLSNRSVFPNTVTFIYLLVYLFKLFRNLFFCFH